MNKYQKILTIVALLIFSTITSGIAKEEQREHDGNWWQTRPKFDKAVYVTGMIDGVYTGVPMLTSSDSMNEILKGANRFSGIRVDHIIDEMDRFYSDQGNRGITAPYALYIVELKLIGAPESEIQMWTQQLHAALKQQEKENR